MKPILCGAVALAMLSAAVPAAADCVPKPIKESWLIEQERLGGQTMDRHVGRNSSELTAWLARDPSVSASSSFPDSRTASQVISVALGQDASSFDNWALTAQPGERAEVRRAFEQPIGVLVERGSPVGIPAHGIKVILEAIGQGDCRLVAAYPTK